MIDKTLGYNKSELEKIVTTNKHISKDIKQEASYRFNVGDTIKGYLTKHLGQTVLKTELGNIIPAKLLQNIEFGKLLEFAIIAEKDGKFILELKSLGSAQLIETIDKIISELKLPNNENVRDIIFKLLGKQLPIDKETITKIYRAEQLYGIPTEVLVNIKEKNSEINFSDIKNLTYMKDGNLTQTVNKLASMIDDVKNTSELKSFLFSISSKLDDGKLQRIIESILGKEFSNTLVETDDLQVNILFENLKNIVSEKLITSNLLLKYNNITVLESIINQTFEALDNTNPKNQIFENLLLKNLTKEVIKSYFNLDMKIIKQDSREALNTTNLHKKLNIILDEVERSFDIKDENLNASLSKNIGKANELLNLSKKYSMDGQYFCFPMLIKEEQRTGELYFFKPKKSAKQSDDKLYIVLALDMPNLNKIEIHIMKIKEDVNLVLKVKTEGVRYHLEDKKEDLLSLIKNIGFKISNIDFKLLEDDKKLTYDEVSLYHLDMKA